MRVYLAARFDSRAEIVLKRKNLYDLELGIIVSSRWLDERVPSTIGIHDLNPSEYLAPAIADIIDIQNSDVLVLFSVDGDTPTKRGGRHWETGFAYGLGKKVIICGPRENIFHFLPDVTVCATWDETKQELLRLFYAGVKRGN